MNQHNFHCYIWLRVYIYLLCAFQMSNADSVCPFLLVDYSVFNQEKVDEGGDASSLDDTDQRLLTFSDSRQDAVTGRALWRQQFSTVAWLHMLSLHRDRKPIVYK